jgi:TetR/AcrR family transcriptional regulator, transcriptional repressor for nem operon
MVVSRQSARRRTNDPEGVKRRLLRAAYRSFVVEGYHATSMHDLKRETGISGGALAHHFPSKKDLALAVLRGEVADVVGETWIAPVLAAPTAREGIQTVFEKIIREIEARAVSGCPLNNLAHELACQDDDFQAEIDAIFVRWREAIEGKIRADQQSGLLLQFDAASLATFVVAAYSGAMAMAKAGQSVQPLRLCANVLGEMMER